MSRRPDHLADAPPATGRYAYTLFEPPVHHHDSRVSRHARLTVFVRSKREAIRLARKALAELGEAGELERWSVSVYRTGDWTLLYQAHLTPRPGIVLRRKYRVISEEL